MLPQNLGGEVPYEYWIFEWPVLYHPHHLSQGSPAVDSRDLLAG